MNRLMWVIEDSLTSFKEGNIDLESARDLIIYEAYSIARDSSKTTNKSNHSQENPSKSSEGVKRRAICNQQEILPKLDSVEERAIISPIKSDPVTSSPDTQTKQDTKE